MNKTGWFALTFGIAPCVFELARTEKISVDNRNKMDKAH